VATYQHPGVYIEEIPSARSIQGVSTSVPAFIGVTTEGPYNKPTLITSWNDFGRTFGNVGWNCYVTWAVYEFFNEGGTSCYVVRTKDSASAKAATATVSGLAVNAISTGTWGNNLGIVVSNSGTTSSTPQTPVFAIKVVVPASNVTAAEGTSLDMQASLLQAYIETNQLPLQGSGTDAYYTLETFNGLTISSNKDAAAASAAAVQQRINSTSIFIRVDASKLTSRPSNTSKPSPLTSGTEPTQAFDTALATLDAVQGLSLLAMPDIVSSTDASGKVTQSGQATLINQNLLYCDNVGSLFYAVDPPFGLDIQGIREFKMGTGENTQALNSTYGAIYYPWVYIYSPQSNSNVPIPPSGPVLGRYAYTDANSGVFKSPAGTSDGALLTVTNLQTQVTDNDQNNLNPEGINTIRNFVGYGNLIWGARTLSSDTEWIYIAVRRLFIYVEQSLKQSLQWVVFEPNDQKLWSAVTRDISAFLTTLWQQGGLFGSTASEAFFVTCDASNNPVETRQQGLLYIDIGLAPVFPAEFVVIRITQITSGPDSGS